MKHLLSILTVSLLAACGGEPKTDSVSEPNAISMTESAKMNVSYPQTAKGDVDDTYFEQ